MVPTREEAIALLNEYVKTENMRQHCLASEAVMRELAIKTAHDEHKWAMTGLLHDLDAGITEEEPKKHGLITAALLREREVDEDMIDAIIMHNDMAHGKERHTTFQHALAAAETITGMIKATTLVYPDKRIASVKPKSVTKRMKQKGFAVSVNRDNILECEKIGVPLQEFVSIAMDGMKKISDDIGL
jgi:putative nucleotidyltransferase with HDIG domain